MAVLSLTHSLTDISGCAVSPIRRVALDSFTSKKKDHLALHLAWYTHNFTDITGFLFFMGSQSLQ